MGIFLYCLSISSRRLQSHTFGLVVLNIVKPIHGAYRKMYFLSNLIKKLTEKFRFTTCKVFLYRTISITVFLCADDCRIIFNPFTVKT